MLARKSFLIFLTNLIGAALGLVMLFFIGRYMTTAAYGMMWVAISSMGIVSFLLKLGMGKAHVKRVSEGQDLARCMGTYIPIKLALVAIFAVLTIAMALGWELTTGFVAATAFPIVLVAILYWVFVGLRQIPEDTFQALRLTASAQVLSIVENLVKAPLVIIVALVFGYLDGREVPLRQVPIWIAERFELVGPMTNATGGFLLAVTFAAGMLISLVVGVVMLRRHKIPVGRFDRDLARSYHAFAWPVAGYAAMKTLNHHIDNVMLGFFWSGDEVGLLAAAQRYATVVLVIPAAVRTLFFPMISEAVARKDWKAVHKLALSAQRMMSLILVPILMLTLLYAADVLRIFVSSAYVPAATALRLYVVHAALTVFTTVNVSILLGMEKQRIVAGIVISKVIVDIVLNLIFIPASILGVPLFGLRETGAALASVIAKAFAAVLYVTIGWRLLGTTHLTMALPKHIAAAALAGAALWTAEHFLGFIQVVRVWELAIAGVVGVLLYVLVLAALREFGRKDLLFFHDLLHPGRMGKYIRKELKGKRQD